MILRKADKKYAANNPSLWTDIPGWPMYAANKTGFILNKEKRFVVTNTLYSNGYVYVSAFNGTEYKNVRLHKLVADALIPNPDNLPQINHEDGDKQNNHVANLRRCTSSYNLKHAFAAGLMKVKKPQFGKFNEQSARSVPVKQLTLEGELVKVWPSIAEAVRNGFQSSNIVKVCTGKRKSHKDFKWSYLIP